MRIYIALVILLSCHFGFAAETTHTHALMTSEEQEIHTRARKRLYPGGRDEDPLKVQSQLPQVTRKMGPAMEAPEDEPADSAHD